MEVAEGLFAQGFPSEVRRAVPLLKKIPPPAFQTLLQAVVIDSDIPEALISEAGADAVAIVYTGLQVIMNEAVRVHAKPEDVVNALLGLEVPQPFAMTVGRVLHGKYVFAVQHRRVRP